MLIQCGVHKQTANTCAHTSRLCWQLYKFTIVFFFLVFFEDAISNFYLRRNSQLFGFGRAGRWEDLHGQTQHRRAHGTSCKEVRAVRGGRRMQLHL